MAMEQHAVKRNVPIWLDVAELNILDQRIEDLRQQMRSCIGIANFELIQEIGHRLDIARARINELRSKLIGR